MQHEDVWKAQDRAASERCLASSVSTELEAKERARPYFGSAVVVTCVVRGQRRYNTATPGWIPPGWTICAV